MFAAGTAAAARSCCLAGSLRAAGEYSDTLVAVHSCCSAWAAAVAAGLADTAGSLPADMRLALEVEVVLGCTVAEVGPAGIHLAEGVCFGVAFHSEAALGVEDHVVAGAAAVVLGTLAAEEDSADTAAVLLVAALCEALSVAVAEHQPVAMVEVDYAVATEVEEHWPDLD